MTIINKKIVSTIFISASLAMSQAFADIYSFDDTAVYDANRSTIEANSGAHSYTENSSVSLGFSWGNTDWGVSEPSWYYDWQGINISQATDTSLIGVKDWYAAGTTYSYSSVTGSGSIDGDSSYGIYYAPVADPMTWMGYDGYSKSEMAKITFDSKMTLDTIDIANSLISAEYLNTTLSDEGDTFLYEVLIYGIISGNKTEDFVKVVLSSAGDGVVMDWVNDIDLSSLNIGTEGLDGISFETYTNDKNAYGALAPAYFAMDNLKYTAYVPEPSTYAMIFGFFALAFVAYKRRKNN